VGFIYLPKPSASTIIASTVRACIEQKKSTEA